MPCMKYLIHSDKRLIHKTSALEILTRPIHIIKSADKTKLSNYTPPHVYVVSLQNYPLYQFVNIRF